MLNISFRPQAGTPSIRISLSLAHRNGPLDKLLALDRLRGLYDRVREQPAECVFDAFLRELDVNYDVDLKDLAAIPTCGRVVVVANHPFGMLEGIVLGALLSRVRSDVKILANHLLAGLPELSERLILVNPFEPRVQAHTNSRGMREAVRWLNAGGMLATFPAGEVSHWDFRVGGASDPSWSADIARLARITGASVFPVYFKGVNSIPFYVLGMMHPMLRTARLPVELLNKAGGSVSLQIGSAIPHARIAGIASDEEAISYVRWRTYLLAKRDEVAVPVACPTVKVSLAKSGTRPGLVTEISRLKGENRIYANGDYTVFYARASEIPAVLKEIGRLREISFRQVGEGTGQETDLDRFDEYYQHLFLWHTRRNEVVGAYRIGSAPDILASRGVNGLYTSTLFRYDARFFQTIGPALELGRSFVRPEYQRQFQPLLLLWKGLAKVVAQNRGMSVLFGAVSISNAYSAVSRRLLAEFFWPKQAHDLRRLVKPRRPFRHGRRSHSIAALCRDLDGLSAAIGDLEPDRKGVPILLQQYYKLGGRIVEFNVDPDFSDCLDALVVVDLKQTNAAILERFMGKQ